MSALLEKIKSRGYWRILIRPDRFIEKRVKDVAELKDILQKTSVHLRLWDFPHVSAMNGHIVDQDWIGQEFEWEYHIEIWRFYQSGQFIYYGALVTDWSNHGYSAIENSAKRLMILNMTDVVYRFVEVFEFAARLALSEAGDENVRIEITLGGLEGRDVWIESDNGMPVPVSRLSPSVDFHYNHDFPRAELIASSQELALDTSVKFFRHLGWNPNLEILREIQSISIR